MATITTQSKIYPCLWFDKDGEKAAKFYTGIFKNSKIRKVTHYGEAGQLPKGTVMTVIFQLEKMEFMALNAGPHFKFTEAVSFVVSCATQKEIDYFWENLSKGGSKVACGWLKDKFGLSWQIVPSALSGMISDTNPEKSQLVMNALMKMKKIDLKALELAYNGSKKA